jgi:hypothetical protein
MRLVGWMAAACGISWLGVTAILGPRTRLAILVGMLGPLLAASVTWILAERTFRRAPGRLTALMIKAFFGKIVFFGIYVAFALNAGTLSPVAFVVSFTSYFIALHTLEAFLLHRLFTGGADRT